MFAAPAFFSVHQVEGHAMPKPQSFDRLFWKAADRIHARLNPGKLELTDLLLPETPWLCWQGSLRRIRRAGLTFDWPFPGERFGQCPFHQFKVILAVEHVAINKIGG